MELFGTRVGMLVAFALISLLQFNTIDATHEHANKVTNSFRRVKLDKTKNAVYQDYVQNAIKTLLKDPLVSKAMLLPSSVTVSSEWMLHFPIFHTKNSAIHLRWFRARFHVLADSFCPSDGFQIAGKIK
uniref:Putative secreted protein n=1 Tax=Anopheles triannulatus TaxID=58253 RepID=A0A2M4B0F0_9DIPT